MDEMPAEVREFLVGRPKCHLNFEEFDYGAASTEGFNAAGLTVRLLRNLSNAHWWCGF